MAGVLARRLYIQRSLDPLGHIKRDVAAGVPQAQGIADYASGIVQTLDAAYYGDCGISASDMEDYVAWLLSGAQP